MGYDVATGGELWRGPSAGASAVLAAILPDGVRAFVRNSRSVLVYRVDPFSLDAAYDCPLTSGSAVAFAVGQIDSDPGIELAMTCNTLMMVFDLETGVLQQQWDHEFLGIGFAEPDHLVETASIGGRATALVGYTTTTGSTMAAGPVRLFGVDDAKLYAEVEVRDVVGPSYGTLTAVAAGPCDASGTAKVLAATTAFPASAFVMDPSSGGPGRRIPIAINSGAAIRGLAVHDESAGPRLYAALTDNGNRFVALDCATGAVLWQVVLPGGPIDYFTSADCDRDGTPEAVVIANRRAVLVRTSDQSVSEPFPPFAAYASATCADLIGTDDPEWLFSDSGSQALEIRAGDDLTLLRRVQFGTFSGQAMSGYRNPLTDTAQIVLANDGRLSLYDLALDAVIWAGPRVPFSTSVTAGDIDGDLQPEIITLTDAGVTFFRREQTPGPGPVHADDDAYVAVEDALLPVPPPGVLDGDTTLGGALSAWLRTPPSSGALVSGLAMNGSFAYRPIENYCGPDSFTYVAGNDTASDIAAVSLTIACVNDAPVADDDAYVTTEDQTHVAGAPGVLVGDSDVDGPNLSVEMITQADHGAVSLSATGGFAYVPAPDYCNSSPGDSPDTFTYHASDGTATSASANVRMAVLCVNDAPAFGGAPYSFAIVEQAVSGTALGAVSATDVEGAVTYLINSGNVDGAFQIDSGGQLLVANPAALTPLNSPFTLVVAASDSEGATTTVSAEVTVRTVSILADGFED